MYACIYNAHTFSNDTESEALAVTGQHGKGVDGLFEKVSFFARRLKMSGATFCQCHQPTSSASLVANSSADYLQDSSHHI